jgi:hypothetical protein
VATASIPDRIRLLLTSVDTALNPVLKAPMVWRMNGVNGARRRLIQDWDVMIARWLAGDAPEAPFDEWWGALAGKGDGAPTSDAMPEPYIGSWAAPKMVTLGLNPGLADFALQGREGVFAKRIQSLGSFADWATSDPYGSSEWENSHGPNVFRRARLKFAQRWLADRKLKGVDLLMVELYPWHSKRVKGLIKTPEHIARRFIWEPLAELDVDLIFAFGSPWRRQCGLMRFETIKTWGRGGEDYGSNVASRIVTEHKINQRQRLVVISQAVYAGPPGTHDTELLRPRLGRRNS